MTTHRGSCKRAMAEAEIFSATTIFILWIRVFCERELRLTNCSGRFGLACKHFLRGAYACAKFNRLSGDLREHLLQGRQNANRIEIVVVADVRHPEKLAFHFSL